MKEEMKGLYAAIVLSIVVIFVSNYLFPKPQPSTIREEKVEVATTKPEKTESAPENTIKTVSVSEALAQDRRVKISNASLLGSLRIKGSRFDELYLSKYKTDLNPESPDVELLTPAKTATPYYAEFGWLSTDKSLKLPDSDTLWNVKSKELSPETPLVLEWNNGQGIKFVRKISLAPEKKREL